MQQWEYCALFGFNKSERTVAPKYPQLFYFTKMGLQTENLSNSGRGDRPPEWQDADEADYVAYRIATLGLEGWELVTALSANYAIESAGATALYFRRPISGTRST